jgi:hypothetical protein
MLIFYITKTSKNKLKVIKSKPIPQKKSFFILMGPTVYNARALVIHEHFLITTSI